MEQRWTDDDLGRTPGRIGEFAPPSQGAETIRLGNLNALLSRWIVEMSGLLEQVVGRDETESLVDLISRRLGAEILRSQSAQDGDTFLNEDQLAEILVSLLSQFAGDCVITRREPGFMELSCPEPVNRLNPSGPSLCRIMLGVLGSIAASVTGFAKVYTSPPRHPSPTQIIIHLDPNRFPTEIDGRIYMSETVELTG